ncbi:peptide deformylase [Streptomyces avermitilis]|uniref:peptide deformylase n=1 Tax=Streptomyces avermitilis TaxID=33903 RepID=UPI0033E86A18
MRDLRQQWEMKREESGASASLVVLQELVRRRPGGAGFDGKRVSDWAPRDETSFKVPQAGSDDRVLALVRVWAEPAGEPVNERWWRDLLEEAREEQARERRHRHDPQAGPGAEGPAFETVATLGARALEVHAAVLPDHSPDEAVPDLPPYLSRAHDDELFAALRPVLDGGPSLLAMMTGDSSSGKTRALYEALRDLAPDRPLLRPLGAESLLGLLRSGRVETGVVLWLNETQRFLYGSNGESAAVELHQLLQRRAGVLVVGTLWQHPYWSELTGQGTPGAVHAHAAALLTGPCTRHIPVPSELTAADRVRWQELAHRHGDRRLTQALKAGAKDNRVVQHLSGGPELLVAYRRGPGEHFSHVEHALITAALDARRLGHRAPLPAALLAAAADGALDARHRPADPHWCAQALAALSTGRRPDGSRTDIRNTLTPLTALRARSGEEAAYEPADYLDQHTRRQRAGVLGTASLWQALLEYTSDPEDLVDVTDHDVTTGLFDAALSRGLYKLATLILRKAVLAGQSVAECELVSLLSRRWDPRGHGLCWVAEHADLSRPVTTPSTASDAMKSIGIVQEGTPVLIDPTRPFELPREAAEAREIVAALHAAADRAATVHTFSKGMGVAAPQIGVGRRVAIVRPAEGDAITLLNPVVVEESSDTDEQFEGCLSFFDVRGKVPRPRTLEVRHQDFGGQFQTTIFTDGLARLVAHEVDHLDGVLYVARMAPGSSTISVAEYKGTGQNWWYSPRSGA